MVKMDFWGSETDSYYYDDQDEFVRYLMRKIHELERQNRELIRGIKVAEMFIVNSDLTNQFSNHLTRIDAPANVYSLYRNNAHHGQRSNQRSSNSTYYSRRPQYQPRLSPGYYQRRYQTYYPSSENY